MSQTTVFISSTNRKLYLSKLKKVRILCRAADKARNVREFSEAALLYEAALEHDSNNAAVHIQCGHMMKESGDRFRAEQHYLSACALTPNDPDLHLQFGHLYKISGRLREAQASYGRAAELAPDSEKPRAEFEAVTSLIEGPIDPRLRPGQSGPMVMQAPPPPPTIHAAPAIQPAPAQAAHSPLSVSPQQIADSGLFDAGWYLKRYPDVAALGQHPLTHFATNGIEEERSPGPRFDPSNYQESYADVNESGMTPFAHYVLTGRQSGYSPGGEELYSVWTKKFDTISEEDRQLIRQHIENDELGSPTVLVHLGAQSTPDQILRVMDSLRQQLLPPLETIFCVAPDCPDDTRDAVWAFAGADASFSVADSVQIKLAALPETPKVKPSGHPLRVVMLRTSVELREHALYMLVGACGPNTALVYADEDRNQSGVRISPRFKPEPSPELYRHTDYIGACALLSGVGLDPLALRHGLVVGDITQSSAVRTAFFGSAPDAVVHVPFVLFHSEPEQVEQPLKPSRQPRLNADRDLPTVSIIIPTRDKVDLLRTCVNSLLGVTNYPRDRFGLVIVDNESSDWKALDLMETLAEAAGDTVVRVSGKFNYSRLNNVAADQSDSDIIVLLNNDTEIQDPSWLRRMVDLCMQPGVGAVGPKLLYADGTIQHAGVVLNVGGVAAHAHVGLRHDQAGYMDLVQLPHEVSAVTGACLAIKRSVFEEVGQLDEKLAVACNDVALCLSCLKHGYRNIYVPDVWVRHFESKSRGADDTPAKVEIFLKEADYVRERFPLQLKADPYYSPNLSLELASLYEPAFPPRAVYPWRSHTRAQARTRILLLSDRLSGTQHDDVAALAYARYFLGNHYDVFIGSAKPHHVPQLAGAIFARLINSRAAAIYARERAIDVVLVFTWPYVPVARLLGKTACTILYYPEDAAMAGRSDAYRRADEIERKLDQSFFDLLVTPSETVANRVKQGAFLICPPGGDLVGEWNAALLPRRDLVRQMRGWHGKTAVLIAVGPGHTLSATFVERLRTLAAELKGNDVTFFIMGASFPQLTGVVDMAPTRPRQDAVFDLYIAADVFLNFLPDGEASPEVAEARTFGLPVVNGEDLLRSLEPGTSTTSSAFQLMEGLLQAAMPGSQRLASGKTWNKALKPLHAAISKSLAASVPRVERSIVALMSDRSLLGWSGLFDADYYCRLYTEVAAEKHDPLSHFSDHGGREGRQPSDLFWTQWYLKTYPEVGRSGVNPLVHFLRQTTGTYDPNPYFCTRSYIDDGETAAKGLVLPPFLHYLRYGAQQGRSVGPNFDAAFYSENYPDIPADTLPIVHFLTCGVVEGRMAVPPSFTPVNVYDPADLARLCELDEASVTWRPVSAAKLVDKRTAVRFCIDLVSGSEVIRAKHPHALSGGVAGSFCQWLIRRGPDELGLSQDAVTAIQDLFEEDFAAPLLQAYLTRADLRTDHPFALLPPGIGGFTRWLMEKGLAELETSVEQIRWLGIALHEDPALNLGRTYLFSSSIQQRFPAGLTMFGQDAFTRWVLDLLPAAERSTVPSSWPSPLTAVEQVRLAYAASPSWREAHPDCFETVAKAAALLEWLKKQAPSFGPGMAAHVAELDTSKLAQNLCVDGVNMIGHFCYPSGLRSSTVSLLNGYRAAGFRATERDVWVEPKEAEPHHASFGGLEVYDTTIIHTQPDPFFDVAYQRAGLAPRTPRTYRIGYWYWELDTIPESWLNQASDLDEIWTATRFVGDALRGRIDLPVHEIMPGFELPPVVAKPRSYFELPENRFLFLFTFHMMSIMERKNPLGLIEAFRQAFPADENVGLVLKTSYGEKHPLLMRELREAARGSNITIIDEIYTQEDVLALMQSCDSYVSLHRSEGYGLTMVEAMLLGKPVIATGYSGNLDFMDSNTAMLVDYELVTLSQTIGPYQAGSQWAEPSVSHAAECLSRVYTDRGFATAMGTRAKSDLEKRLSYVAAGKRMAARLSDIKNLPREAPGSKMLQSPNASRQNDS